MKIIARNLPVNVNYEIIDSYSSEDYSQCENCGRILKNICKVKSKNGIYIVGTECADRLSGIEPSQIAEIKRKLNKQKRLIKRLHTIQKKEGLLIEIGKNIVWFHSAKTCNWAFWQGRAGKKNFEEKFKPHYQIFKDPNLYKTPEQVREIIEENCKKRNEGTLYPKLTN